MVEQIGGVWPGEDGLYPAYVDAVYGPVRMTADDMRRFVAQQEAVAKAYLAGGTADAVLERLAVEGQAQAQARARQAAQEKAARDAARAQREAELVAQKQAAQERYLQDAGEGANLLWFERQWQEYLARAAIIESVA